MNKWTSEEACIACYIARSTSSQRGKPIPGKNHHITVIHKPLACGKEGFFRTFLKRKLVIGLARMQQTCVFISLSVRRKDRLIFRAWQNNFNGDILFQGNPHEQLIGPFSQCGVKYNLLFTLLRGLQELSELLGNKISGFLIA